MIIKVVVSRPASYFGLDTLLGLLGLGTSLGLFDFTIFSARKGFFANALGLVFCSCIFRGLGLSILGLGREL